MPPSPSLDCFAVPPRDDEQKKHPSAPFLSCNTRTIVKFNLYYHIVSKFFSFFCFFKKNYLPLSPVKRILIEAKA